MNKAPCRNCPDRYPGCHDKCQKKEYLEERDWRARVRAGKTADHNSRKASISWEARNSFNRRKKGTNNG